MLEKLRALKERHRIKFMSWVGGEPLLRRTIIEAAAEMFETNVMFTNGLLPIPDLPIAIGVSLDGLPEVNDDIRGRGVFAKVVKNLRGLSRPVFIQSVVNKRNVSDLEEFTELISGLPNVAGVIFSIYVPQKHDASGLAFTLAERDRVLDRMLTLKRRFGEFVFNEVRALELAHSSTCKSITDSCDMRTRSLALDYRLNRRRPCCYGENVDCDLCAAPTPFSQAAKRESHSSESVVGASGLPGAIQLASRR